MRRSVAAALMSTTQGAMPVFLLGALAVQIREDLGFSDARLGAAVAVFFAVAAIGSTPAGRALQRVGAYRGLVVTAVLSAAALLGIGLVAGSYAHLLAFLVVGGAAQAVAQPAANLLLASRTPYGRQGVLFGVKQAAVPVTTLVAGAAVPAIALTLGWRWAFALVATGSAMLWLVAPRELVPPPRRRAARDPAAERAAIPNMTALLVLTGGGVLASSAVNSLGVFYVPSAVAAGVPPGTAGGLLAAGSVLAIVSRITVGWRADIRDTDLQRVVTRMLVVGGLGFALLAFGDSRALLLAGTVVGFLVGWGWNGLFTFTVVRRYPRAPAAATGITQTGLWIGGTVGPLCFGLVAETVSYPGAWLGAAVLMVLAAACVATSRRRYEQPPRPAAPGR